MDTKLSKQEITELGVNAVIDFYSTIAIDRMELPGMHIFATGVDSTSLNVVIDTRDNAEFDLEIIEPINVFFQKYKVPWAWFVTPAVKVSRAKEHGLHLLYETPGMYFDLSGALPEMKTKMDIKEAQDDLKEWIEPLREGFPTASGKEDDLYRKLNADLLLKGEKKLRHFTLYFHHEAACSGTLFLSENAVMLHNLATKCKFRKCGLGTVLTLTMMSYAKQAGYQHCFLDSSDEGFNLYERLGFKMYGKTLEYAISYSPQILR